MNRGARTWVVLGWVAFALLPWHFAAGEWYEHLVALTPRGLTSAAGLALTGKAWWLAPIVAPLLLATWPLITRQSAEQAARWLIVAGLLGLALITLQGFAIGLRGWSWTWLSVLGAPGPSQAGMGTGAASP
jgi:iron(III) transport system permease protein